ncbi:hypothetical protein PIB30_047616 [Stylosanthes scabra]|uniref:Uncharacterized protein n=1 Tax=Stylosanthes scabra TaxID=79078 RepID=A0ABU6RGX4_9FABA|nr:hypothetical protein [Stylosanthes scabra]
MISFSPARQASPYQAAEFTRIVESFRVSQAQHVDHGYRHGPWIPTYSSPLVMEYPVFDPSHVGSEYATPPSYHAPSSYHSHSFDRHSAPTPTMTHPAPDPPTSDTPAADPPLPPSPGKPHRTTRPPPCGSGGHIHPHGDRQ